MLECPIDYFTDNLVFNRDKSCWAFFEIHGYDYDMLSNESKIGILNSITRVISNIETEAQIMIIPVVQNLDSHFDKLIKGLRKEDPLYGNAIGQANTTKQYLQQSSSNNGKTNDYRTFISFKLQKADETDIAALTKDIINFFLHSVINDFNAALRLDGKDIPKEKIEHFRKMADEICLDQQKRIGLSPVTAKTVQWLIRRAMFRGLAEDTRLFHRAAGMPWIPSNDVIKLGKEEYLRPRRKEIVNLFSGTISKSERTIKITNDNQTSYQTFLSITNIPEDLSFPDCEWIYRLQQYNQQAEVYITIKAIEHRAALKKLDNQRRAADSQEKNIIKANADVPDDLLESQAAINEIEAELKESKSPLIQTSVTICLAADNQENLEKKVILIKNDYEDMNFVVERPLTDQLDLWMQCLPTVGFCVSDFIMRMTPKALAAGLIGATHELGSINGAFIGTTGRERKNVFLNLKDACLSNVSASTTLYGNLGYGKSFNANLLIYLHVLYFGAYGLIWDPKGERSHWVMELKALDGMITLVTLSPDPKYVGTLDPYNIFRDDVNEASELAINILADLFKLQPKDEEYVALLEAVHKNKKEPLPSMQRLAEILETVNEKDDLYKAATMLARRIRVQREVGMSQLLFGNGTEDAITLSNRLNILQVQNLKLPDPKTKKEEYSSEETISTVLMSVIAAFSRRFIHSHPNDLKVLLFDESWMLGRTKEGEKLMSYVGRMSRSLYAAMILNGHSVTDLPNEGIRNSITYKFCFHTDNQEEAKRMLEYMKLEGTKSNIDLIMSLKNAQCLFQDLKGRVGVLTFDAVFQDLIDVFSTTPVDASNLEPTAAAEEQTEEPEYIAAAELQQVETDGAVDQEAGAELDPPAEEPKEAPEIAAAEAQGNNPDIKKTECQDVSAIDIFAYE